MPPNPSQKGEILGGGKYQDTHHPSALLPPPRREFCPMGKGESPIDPWGVPSLTRRRYWLCTRLGLDIAEGKDFNYNSREGAGLDAPRSRDFLLAEDSRDRLARRRGP